VNVLVKIAEFEFDVVARVEVVEFERLKIANENVSGQLGILDAGEIVEGLLFGFGQVASGAFLLDEEGALPKQIDEARSSRSLTLDRFFECRDLASLDAKDFEEFIVEGLRLALFIVGVFPFLGEPVGSVSYLVPRKPYMALRAAVASVR
jgi:hypothetical protein